MFRPLTRLPGASTFTILAIASPPLVYLFVRSLKSYRHWLALGPGGFPPNPLGWLAQSIFQIGVAERDTTSTGCYDQSPGSHDREDKVPESEAEVHGKTFLGDWKLPKREGGRAKVAPFVVPQRLELGEERTLEEIKELEYSAFNNLFTRYTHKLEIRTSRLERHGQALFTAPHIPQLASTGRIGREIAHIHESDGSSHVSLTYRDAKAAIEASWAERHPLDKVLGNMSYVFVYAPRSKEEVEVVGRLWEAGVRFMVGERGE
ncbi:MAG: hypothetical protein Q9227_001873 [Pyrenula ochraceoflavens]